MKIRLIIAFTIICSTLFAQNADKLRIISNLHTITKKHGYRHYLNLKALNGVAHYIELELRNNCDSVYFQEFQVEGRTYKNVIGCINMDKKERLIIGAHYDVCGEQEGADDNASGVVGVIELSRLLKNKELPFRVDFVAYTLEEPPFFGTENMGSYVHAKYLYDNKIPLKGMICLEMIGYFSDKENSQSYPAKVLEPLFGTKGNYIMLVQKIGDGKFSQAFEKEMKSANLIETKPFKGSSKVTGTDFSDHRNYWKFNYDAVMVTNTAFYRNHNYHKSTDKMETLDFQRMALVIDEIYYSILRLK